jgi:hypothetical protein
MTMGAPDHLFIMLVSGDCGDKSMRRYISARAMISGNIRNRREFLATPRERRYSKGEDSSR